MPPILRHVVKFGADMLSAMFVMWTLNNGIFLEFEWDYRIGYKETFILFYFISTLLSTALIRPMMYLIQSVDQATVSFGMAQEIEKEITSVQSVLVRHLVLVLTYAVLWLIIVTIVWWF